MKRPSLIILLSLITAFLTACSGAAPTPTATSTPPVAANVATSVQLPSRTPAPRPSATATRTQIPKPSATAGPDFGQASILSVAHLEGKRLMVSIHVPDGVEGAFDAYVGSTYLPCETPYQYPERIICVGPEPYVNYSPEGALIQLYPLYPDPEAPPLFEAFITVPAQATPTATAPYFELPVPDFFP